MSTIKTSEVFPLLEKSILADGFDVVMDFEKSHGARFYDAKHQREYIDFFSFFASNPIGYNHAKLNDSDFLKDLQTASKIKISNSDVYSNLYADFVHYFHTNFTQSFDKLFFIEGGALGVENAIKAAQDWKVQKNLQAGKGELGTEVLHFYQAFHGRSGYTLSVTNTTPDKTRYFAKFDWPRVVNPKMCFPRNERAQTCTQELEKFSEEQIKKAFHDRKDRICSILIEPIQGEGGDNFFRKEFLQKLHQLCRENEALLIFDEVQTGLGMTGKNWAHEHFGVYPDLMAFGKKVQVCGTAARFEKLQEVEHVFKKSSRINSTWGGNLCDMVRSRKFMEIVIEEKLVEHAADLGRKMLSRLKQLSERFEELSNVRGLGLWIAFDLPTTQARNELLQQLWKNGLMILPCGNFSIRLRPVLNITEQEANEGLDIIETTFGEVYSAAT